MARTAEFPDVTTLRLPEGSFAHITSLLKRQEGETLADFLRASVLREVERRQRAVARLPAPPKRKRRQP